MAKLAILRPLNQIARPLEGARTQIAIEVFRVIFGALYQDHFLNSKIFIFHSTLVLKRLTDQTRVSLWTPAVKTSFSFFWSSQTPAEIYWHPR